MRDVLWDDYYVARHSKDEQRIRQTRAAIEQEAATPLLDRLAKLERENAELRRVLNEGLWDWPSGVLPTSEPEQ